MLADGVAFRTLLTRRTSEATQEFYWRNWGIGEAGTTGSSWMLELELKDGGWELTAASWKLEAGGWKLGAGSWKLEADLQNPRRRPLQVVLGQFWKR